MRQASTTILMEAMVSAANEIATTLLGYGEGVVVRSSSELPAIQSGALITLIGDEENFQLGMATSHDNAVKMARSLFGMEPEDGALDEQDVADALGEIANVLAGGVKTRIAAQSETLNIGLPVVLQGPIAKPKAISVAVSDIRWNQAEAQLVLLRHDTGG